MPTQALWFRLTRRRVSALVHVFGLLLFVASLYSIQNITNPRHGGFGGSFKFLTVIALTLSTTTFAVGIFADLTLNRHVLNLKNGISICVTPLEVLIAVGYWSLRAVNKGLVTPPGHEPPLLIDIGFHAMPAIMLLLDFLFLSSNWSITTRDSFALNLVLLLLYSIWVEYCHTRNGWYPYPPLDVLAAWQKMGIWIAATALMTGCTVSLKWLYRRLPRLEPKDKAYASGTKSD